jgi:hypothetical protein
MFVGTAYGRIAGPARELAAEIFAFAHVETLSGVKRPLERGWRPDLSVDTGAEGREKAGRDPLRVTWCAFAKNLGGMGGGQAPRPGRTGRA